jgi:hypothetical protein
VKLGWVVVVAGDPAACVVVLAAVVRLVLVVVAVTAWVVFVFIKLVLVLVVFVANAVSALKGNAILKTNSTAIIDFLLIIPPPCPRDSKELFRESFRT